MGTERSSRHTCQVARRRQHAVSLPPYSLCTVGELAMPGAQLCLLLQLVLAVLSSCSQTNIARRAKFGKYLPVDAFRRIVGITLNACGKECLARPRCQSFNFDKRFGSCFLNTQSSQGGTGPDLEDRQYHVFGDSSDLLDLGVQDCASVCGNTARCELTNSHINCTYPDCGPRNIPYSYRHGNMWSTGRRLKLECLPEFDAIGSRFTVTCHDDGLWTGTDISCEKACTNGWIGYNNVSRVCLVTTKLTWDQSKGTCEKKRSQLIKITDNDENNFIKELIRVDPGRNYYIGARYDDVKQGLYWTDGSNVTFIPSPNDLQSQSENPGACVEFRDRRLRWRFRQCSTQKYSICEKV